ncbi:MAG: hypothetical protein LCH54_15765 [Bacteroidetes bacterium]|nr:hypothetical protein [Bacteroidota bacterium]
MISETQLTYLLFAMLCGSILMNIGLGMFNFSLKQQLEDVYFPVENYDLFYEECLGGDNSPSARFKASNETLQLIKRLAEKDKQAEMKYRKIQNDAVTEIRSNQTARYNPESGLLSAGEQE